MTAPVLHTPGPWLYRPKEYDDWGIVCASELDEDGFQRVICQASYVASPDELSQHRSNKTDPAEANARLIAAAPDLLAALQCFVENARVGAGNKPVTRSARVNCSAGVYHDARAAIAKATS